ncbi:MAG: FtsX-like permease family protein [Clostridia bacterium]|nr:FtsX-like permease family protein [Clostridia bacterium]
MKNHKALTVNRLAVGNLKTRKKQYTLMIIGILLAMIFSSATLFFLSCMHTSKQEQARRDIGNYYGYFYNPKDYIDVEKGQKNGYIESFGYAYVQGWAYTDAEKQDKGTAIARLDEEAKKLYYVTVLEGRYPENKGEIALEKDAAVRLGIEQEIGSEITLYVQTANGEDFSNEANEKNYTLVGILSDKRYNFERTSGRSIFPVIPAAFVSDNEEIAAGGLEIPALYYNPTEESLKDNIPKTYYYDNGEIADVFHTNAFWEYFMQEVFDNLDLYQDADYNNHLTQVNTDYGYTIAFVDNTTLLVVLAVVLMIASCMGIVNAFTTNLQERRRQIGLLRAVGTTKRQIVNIFGREAFIITLICTPLSIAVSYFAVWLFAKIMGGSFIFMPNILVLMGTTVVSIACVMLSALVPLLRAARISPMQAIRNIDLSRKMKRKKIKQEKDFNAPKLLAKRSIKFYKAKQIGVSIILTLTILLTCFGFSVISAELESSYWNYSQRGDYIVVRQSYPGVSNYINMFTIDKGISTNDIQDILDYSLFESVYGYKTATSFITVDEYSDYMDMLSMTWQGIRYYNNVTGYTNADFEIPDMTFEKLKKLWLNKGEELNYPILKKESQTDKEMFKVEIKGYDERMIRENLDRFEIVDGKIDVDKLNSGEEILLVAPPEIGFSARFNTKGEIDHYTVYDMTSLPDYFYRENRKVFATVKLDYKAGDTIDLKTLFSDTTSFDYEEYGEHPKFADMYSTEKQVKIGAIIKPFFIGDWMYSSTEFDIITTAAGADAITKTELPYQELNIDFKGEVDEETDKSATAHLDTIFSGTHYRAESGFQTQQENMETLKMLIICLISIVILFFSICASIVNNSLTAKIRESKREIGTLRAVGASVKEITQSYIRQLLSMFAWGCGIGFGGYIIGHLGIIAYFKDPDYLTFEIWQAMLIIAVLFLICSINLYAKIKKEMKNSIVENIREL